jgi:hypothetical protein
VAARLGCDRHLRRLPGAGVVGRERHAADRSAVEFRDQDRSAGVDMDSDRVRELPAVPFLKDRYRVIHSSLRARNAAASAAFFSKRTVTPSLSIIRAR